MPEKKWFAPAGLAWVLLVLKFPFQILQNAATIWRKEQLPQLNTKMASACRHPRVRVVSRHEETEYVECLECGEIFDSEEFRDMEIEDTAETEVAQDDA